ncbi:MAG: aminotransferase class I and II, partial [Chloroflexi bacterium]|nr:aminotransferase class I and II [Chloroflexota bacterium]
GRALGLLVPELVLIELDPDLARTERDPEIQALIRASAGLNVALDYLPGALGFDALDRSQVDSALASAIVWFDAYLSNVDRTARNPNMLFWKKRLWLIDHGAALYFHHTWDQAEAFSRSPFAPIREHVLLPVANAIAEADTRLRPRLSASWLESLVALVPEAWLNEPTRFASPDAHRAACAEYLCARLDAAPIFVREALHARAQLI